MVMRNFNDKECIDALYYLNIFNTVLVVIFFELTKDFNIQSSEISLANFSLAKIALALFVRLQVSRISIYHDRTSLHPNS